MKTFYKIDIKTLIIIGLVIFLLLRNCGGTSGGEIETVKVDGKKYELLKQKTDTVYIEKEVKVPTYVPKYITKVVTETVEVPIDVDTLAIIERYYATYEVKDTLNLTYDFPSGVTDSLGQRPSPNLGFGILTDRISQNSVVSRDVNWYFKIPTVYNTTIVKELPKNQFYYGFNLGVNQTDIFSSASGGLIWKTKKDRLYQLNLGVSSVDGGVSPYVGGGMFWKIKLGK
jgi:hypothetical protein